MKGKRAKCAAEERTRRLAEAILKVRGGTWTAAQASRELGMSRRTYYKWENRALAALLGALEKPRGGRPKKAVDAEKEALKRETARLGKEAEALRQSLEIRRWMTERGSRKGEKR